MKRLGIMALGAVLLASLAAAQSVSLNAKAEPLGEVLAELSKQSGKSLTCAGFLRNEPIILRFADQPIDEVMNRIASVTGCRWTASGNGMMLERDPAAENADREKVNAKRVARARQVIAEWLNTNPAKPWSLDAAKKEIEADVQQMNQILEQVRKNNPTFGTDGSNLSIQIMGGEISTPASRALHAMIEKLPPEILTSVEPMQRVVYSTNRTQRQAAMPLAVESPQVLRQFIADYNLLVKARADVIQPGPNIKYMSELSRAVTPVQWPVKGLLIVTRPSGSTGDNVMVELKIADSSGRIIGSSSTSFSLTPEADSGEISDAGKVIELSPTSEQIIKMLTQYKVMDPSQQSIQMAGRGSFRVTLNRPGEGAPPALSQEMLAILSQPVNHEPLSFHVAECLMQLAEEEDASLAALPNDDIYLPLAKLLSAGTLSTERLKRELLKSGLEISTDSDWMEVKAPVRSDSYHSRVSRGDLANLQGHFLRNGYVTLRELGRYALSTKKGQFDQAYIAILNKPAGDILFGSDQERIFLQLIGSLRFNDPARVQPGEVPITSLTSDQRRLVEQIYYGPFGGGIIGNGRSVMVGLSQGDDGPPEPTGPTLADEPTEAHPTGLPGNAMLSISLNEVEDAVLARSPNTHRTMFFTAESMGMTQSFLERGDSFAMDTLNPGTQGMTFQPAQATGVSIAIKIGEDAGASTHFQDAWVLAGSAPVPMDRLSGAFLDAVKAAKERSSNMGFSFGGAERRQEPPR